MNPCASPISFETLVDLWTFELPSADAVEAHLFSCDACARASERVGALLEALRAVVPPVISHARLERLRSAGLRIGRTWIEPGDSRARFLPEFDLLVHALRADLSRAEQVDLEIDSPSGQMDLVHVPFDRDSGELLIACERHYQPLGDPTFKVYAVQGGERRKVAEYFVVHEWPV
jgi:hypothetical protein